MERQDNVEQFIDCIAKVLSLPRSRITAQSSPRTLPDWDSLSQIGIVLEVERRFHVRFATEDIPKLDSLAKLDAAVRKARRSPAR